MTVLILRYSIENCSINKMEVTCKALTKLQLQSNLSNTDTEGTEQSVRIREVSVV